MDETTAIRAARTPGEIVARIAEVQARDRLGLGFEAEPLILVLPYEHALPFLKEGTPPEDWKADPHDRQSIIECMRDYMGFAWEKVLGERGISAIRSVSKMRAWLWLLGDDEALAFSGDRANYPMYGEPILRYICRKYGFDAPEGGCADTEPIEDDSAE